MEFELAEHRHAFSVVSGDEYSEDFHALLGVIKGISENEIIAEYNSNRGNSTKSISKAINTLLKVKLEEIGWATESPIFSDPSYHKERTRWRLDFAKGEFSVEVAFNHAEAIAHNIMKPVLASELNHVSKSLQTSVGVIIVATKRMKKAGNFDGSIGTYEKFLTYLKPYRNFITCPLIIIGLKPPMTFEVDKNDKTIRMINS